MLLGRNRTPSELSWCVKDFLLWWYFSCFSMGDFEGWFKRFNNSYQGTWFYWENHGGYLYLEPHPRGNCLDFPEVVCIKRDMAAVRSRFDQQAGSWSWSFFFWCFVPPIFYVELEKKNYPCKFKRVGCRWAVWIANLSLNILHAARLMILRAFKECFTLLRGRAVSHKKSDALQNVPQKTSKNTLLRPGGGHSKAGKSKDGFLKWFG